MACEEKLKKREAAKAKAYTEHELWSEAVKLARGWHRVISPYLSQSGRERLFKKCGEKAFLLIEVDKKGNKVTRKFKYPIANPDTCNPHPKGVAAAFLRSGTLRKYSKIHQEVHNLAAKLLIDYLEHHDFTIDYKPILYIKDESSKKKKKKQ